ncbi:hypothetical protein [Segatella oris]|uniref:hypothetical protein n=1 Tax=Segatella oris TaxID=28135 RepID=UPI0014755F96|nr:hypothetical protein [Segatella oris]
MVLEGDTDYDGSIVDWYVWLKHHVSWRFPMHGGTGSGEELMVHFGRGGKDQQALLQWLGKNLGQRSFSYGKVERAMARKDNSPCRKSTWTMSWCCR